MSLSAEEFYKQFYCRFQELVKQNRGKYDKTKSDPEWTSYVKDGFLKNLGEELGYSVHTEQVFGVDLLFQKKSEQDSIAVEHENDPKGIWKKEIPNLLKTAASLKVLITYVNDTEFPGKEIADKLYDELKEKDFKEEFLPILGAFSMKEPSDWVGYFYHRELSCQTLTTCSNMLEAEKNPAHKAWNKRKIPK